MESNQRWLSLDGICTVLMTTDKHVWWLVKNRYLEVLWGPGKNKKGARFLDPTPEYAERLRKSEMIYGRRQPLPEDFDLPSAALFTPREVGEIMGWDYGRTTRFLYKRRKKLTPTKAGKHVGAARLYTAAMIRDMLWKRGDRTMAHQRSPFLIRELLDWFQRFRLREEEEVPTDLQFQEDDLLQRKLERLMKMPSPQKEAALQEFLEKMDLARDAVQTKAATD